MAPDEELPPSLDSKDESGHAIVPASGGLEAVDPELDAGPLRAEYRELLADPVFREDLIERAASIVVSEATIGPVPPPSFLRQYIEMYPAAADDVFERYRLEGVMARDEQLHRHAMERESQGHSVTQERLALTEQIAQSRRGQQYAREIAFAVLAVSLLVILVALWLNQPWVAVAGGGAIIVEMYWIATVFTRAENSVNEEMARKREGSVASDDVGRVDAPAAPLPPPRNTSDATQ